MFPQAKDDFTIKANKNKNDDDADEKEDDDYYNEEEKEDENPFEKEPTDKDIVEEEVPIVDPEEDLFDDDEEIPYN